MMSCFPSLLGAFFSELPTLEEVEKTSQKLLFWRPKKALISNSIESLLNFSPPDRRAEWLELGLKAVVGWYLGRKHSGVYPIQSGTFGNLLVSSLFTVTPE